MIKGIDPKRPIAHQNISNLRATTPPPPHLNYSSLESMQKKGSCLSWVKNYFLSIASSMMNILSSFFNFIRALVCFPSKTLRPKITNVESQAGHLPKVSATLLDPKSPFGTLLFENTANGEYKTDSHNHLIFKMKKGISLISDIHSFFADNNMVEWYQHQYTTIKGITNKLKEMKMHPLEYLYYSVMEKNSRENLEIFLYKYPIPIRWKIHSKFIKKQVKKFNQFNLEETLSYIPDYCQLLKFNTESFLSLAKEGKWEEFIWKTLENTK